MRTLISIAVLAVVSMPAFAVQAVPEPDTWSLLAAGALGLMIARRRKK